MNSKNRKTSDPHRLLINLTDKIDLERKDCFIKSQHLLQMEKYKKSYIRIMNFKHQPQGGMKNLSYLKGHILYQIFKIIFECILKNYGK